MGQVCYNYLLFNELFKGLIMRMREKTSKCEDLSIVVSEVNIWIFNTIDFDKMNFVSNCECNSSIPKKFTLKVILECLPHIPFLDKVY